LSAGTAWLVKTASVGLREEIPGRADHAEARSLGELQVDHREVDASLEQELDALILGRRNRDRWSSGMALASACMTAAACVAESSTMRTRKVT
jgi:hypothetical protein